MNKDERQALLASARASIKTGGQRDVEKAQAKATIVLADTLTEILALMLQAKR